MEDFAFTVCNAILGVGFILVCLVGAVACALRIGSGQRIHNDTEDQ
jgi:hypothetical protein